MFMKGWHVMWLRGWTRVHRILPPATHPGCHISDASPVGSVRTMYLLNIQSSPRRSRGGTYAEDLPTPPSRFAHQKSYIEFWLRFIGVREVRILVVEGTSRLGKEKRKYSVERGK